MNKQPPASNTTPVSKKKCALYIRVSTDAQAEEGYSIPAQKERLEAYCKALDMQNQEAYIDPGFSGSNLERPMMQQLIADAKAEKLSTVVVYKLDRLSRSQKDTLYLIEDVFIPNHVDFVSVNENIDTSTPYGRAMIGILSAFAQLERENIYQRTRMGMLERVKQGYWMGGGVVPYGYRYDRNTGILVPHPTESVTVKKIYDLFIQGYSAQAIANLLGLKYDRLVYQILTRRCNLGLISYKGEEYQGRHTPLVSQEVFDLAQIKIRERSEKCKSTAQHQHLLTGLIYCGVCGARLRYIRWGKSGYKLMCYSHDKSKAYMRRSEDCPSEPVWADQIETMVLDDLFALSANLKGRSCPDGTAWTDPLEELNVRIREMESKIKRLYNLYAQNEDTLLLSTIAENTEELNRLKQQYAGEEKNHRKLRHLGAVCDQVASIRTTWPYLTDQERQVLIRDCVEKIVIFPNKVELFYTFIKAEPPEHSETA